MADQPNPPTTSDTAARLTTIAEPCYYCNGAGCGYCDPNLDMSPSGVVQRAVNALSTPGSCELDCDEAIVDCLAELLQIISDDMRDENADEKEFPNHIPKARWLVVDSLGHHSFSQQTGWTAALALARVILGLPDPNLAEAGEQA